MNCHDVREEFSALSRGGLGLTEWALVHAHVMQCVDCRKERESLQRVEPSRGPTNVTASLTPLGALLPMVRAPSVRAAAHLTGHVHFVITRGAHLLIWLLSALTIACQGAARAAIEAARVGVRSLSLVTRLRVLVSISLTVSGQVAVRVIEAARAGVARVAGLPTRVRWLLLLLFTPSIRVAANLIGHVPLAITRSGQLLIRLRSSLMIACQEAGRAAIAAAGAGVTRFLSLLTRLRVLMSISFTGSVGAAGRVIAAGRIGAMRIPDLLIRVIGTTRAVGRIVVTTSSRARSHLGARTSALRQRKAAAWTRARPLLRVCTGIVSLAVLVAAIVLLWPRQWPDNLMDRKPADLAAPAPVARTSAPGPVSAPQPAPVQVSRPETPRAAMRPRPIAAQDEIPAPLRRPDPALAQGRPTASAPLPSTEATQNAEDSDPTAAIDWLLKGGSSRQHPQSP